MEVSIRRANPGDAAQLAKLRWDFSPEQVATGEMSFDSFRTGFEAFVSKALESGWTVWVAEVSGNLVGTMWVYLIEKVPRPSKGPGHMGYLTNVYIDQGYRGQGIGERMLADIIDWGRERNLELLLVWPSAESISFYQRAGFKPSREIQGEAESVLELHF